MANKIKAGFDRIDILINNAGIWHRTGLQDEIAPEALAATVQGTLTGTIELIRALLPALRVGDDAAILNDMLISAIAAQADQSVYAASKYGMRGFAEILKEDGDLCGARAGLYQSDTNTLIFAKAGEEVPTPFSPNRMIRQMWPCACCHAPPKRWRHGVRIEPKQQYSYQKTRLG